MGDHRLEEGVPVNPVGIPQVDEADGRGPHGGAVPGRGDAGLVPRLPEVLVVVEKLPGGLPDSPDMLPREPLGQIIGIEDKYPASRITAPELSHGLSLPTSAAKSAGDITRIPCHSFNSRR